MTVEIWSDVVCPFCYIGKKSFEEALSKIENSGNISVAWKSYQLNPDMGNSPVPTLDYLAQSKGMHKDDVREMFSRIVRMGKEKGIDFRFDKSISVNTRAAHLLIQAAKEKGVANQVEEAFFKAHFEGGKNVADPEVIRETGLSSGMTLEEIEDSQTNPKYASSFEKDIYDARQIGVRGVPFFVINNKYGISGAQPVEIFEQTLRKALAEDKPLTIVTEGDACDMDGNCD